MKVIIIPGGQILPVNKIGYYLQIRCDKALELFLTGGFDYILVTGGITNPKETQTVSEAEIIREWLLSKKVPSEAIIMESRSLDSFENIKFGLEALGNCAIEASEITVVSQWQHTIRYWITLKLGYGVAAKVRLIKLHPRMSWKAIITEWFFILYHLLDWRGEKPPARLHREKIRNKLL